MSLYSNIAEQLQFVAPQFYKRRFFKKLHLLNDENVISRKVEPELLWIKKFLKKDDVFIDIGANVGAYLFSVETQLPVENIYAFEPNDKLFTRLKRIFPGVHIFKIGLSDFNGEANFKIPLMNGKKIASRGTLQTSQKEEDETSFEELKVEVKKLDDFQPVNQLNRIDFIKIDVEGNEMETLRGAENTIKKLKPVLMVEMEQRHHQTPLWNLISEIENWGYESNFLNRETLQPQRLTEEILVQQNSENLKNYSVYINNIIFLPTK